MEDDQQFCLRWNNHQSTLIQNFDTLLESGTLVDCTLAAEGKYLKAHKVVLSACSPYFEGLLSEHYDKHPVFILKDVKFKELKAMMDYMYRGEVNISQDQLAALLKAAESLQIKGLSESKTSGSSKMDTRQQKVVPQTAAPSSLDIPHMSSGLTIEKNKVPRQGVAQGSIGDHPDDSASPQIPKGLSSREGSQSPTSRKRKRFRRRSIGDDNSIENHETSNSSDMPQQMGVPALGIAPVADEKTHADPTDTVGRSTLMAQLTKPADELLQLPLEKPEPNDNLIEPKSEYMEDPEESVEDLTLDDDMNDLTEMEQDSNRAGPSHDPTQHPAGIGAWHVSGDRSNAGGVVGSVAGAPGTTDEVFLAAQEAAQAHRDSQGVGRKRVTVSSSERQPAMTSIGVDRRSRGTGSSQNLRDGGATKKTGRRAGCNANENVTAISNTNFRGDATNSRGDAINSRGGVTNSKDVATNSRSDRNSKCSEEWTDLNDLANDPNLGIPCPYCNKKFVRKRHLGWHVKNNCLENPRAKCNTERDIKPFVCLGNCGRRFGQEKNLTYHMQHECSKSLACHLCGIMLAVSSWKSHTTRTCRMLPHNRLERTMSNTSVISIIDSTSSSDSSTPSFSTIDTPDFSCNRTSTSVPISIPVCTAIKDSISTSSPTSSSIPTFIFTSSSPSAFAAVRVSASTQSTASAKRQRTGDPKSSHSRKVAASDKVATVQGSSGRHRATTGYETITGPTAMVASHERSVSRSIPVTASKRIGSSVQDVNYERPSNLVRITSPEQITLVKRKRTTNTKPLV